MSGTVSAWDPTYLKATDQVLALIAVADVHADPNSPQGRSLLTAVLPRTDAAVAAFGAMLVHQQIAAHGRSHRTVVRQATSVVLHDRMGTPLRKLRAS